MFYEITKFYLPPDRDDVPTIISAEIGIRFNDFGRMNSSVDLAPPIGGLLVVS